MERYSTVAQIGDSIQYAESSHVFSLFEAPLFSCREGPEVGVKIS